MSAEACRGTRASGTCAAAKLCAGRVRTREPPEEKGERCRRRRTEGQRWKHKLAKLAKRKGPLPHERRITESIGSWGRDATRGSLGGVIERRQRPTREATRYGATLRREPTARTRGGRRRRRPRGLGRLGRLAWRRRRVVVEISGGPSAASTERGRSPRGSASRSDPTLRCLVGFPPRCRYESRMRVFEPFQHPRTFFSSLSLSALTEAGRGSLCSEESPPNAQQRPGFQWKAGIRGTVLEGFHGSQVTQGPPSHPGGHTCVPQEMVAPERLEGRRRNFVAEPGATKPSRAHYGWINT